MIGYIYKTTNLINNLIYIGLHCAKEFDITYKGSGTQLKKAFKEFGWTNFKCELLEECDTLETLCEAEKKWINFFNSRNPSIGYNKSIGGKEYGFFRDCKHSIDTKQKIKKASLSRVVIYKDNVNKCINKKELQNYLDNGWKQGYFSNENKIYVNDGKICFCIKKEQLEEYLEKGYERGFLPYKRSESFKQKVAETNRNKICIHKDNIQTRIFKKDLEKYLSEGWLLGWVKKEKILKIKPGTGQKKSMYNHNLNKYEQVYESNWQQYLNEGWIFKGKEHIKYEHKTKKSSL